MLSSTRPAGARSLNSRGTRSGGASPAAAGIGFCALTTYSTFGYETLRLSQQRARFYAVANVAATLLAGLGAAYGGLALAQATTG
jgi:fluoride exporter